ncbi:MAG TPA: hypothetical protein VG325_02090 [Solirubrobacteraceae bacterium]|jgi:hypothetical protein|nr:hypothetical protein [Solirubrobacteraceae bacterium]
MSERPFGNSRRVSSVIGTPLRASVIDTPVRASVIGTPVRDVRDRDGGED